MDEIEDFGSVNASGGLCYTDYKKAHVDENLLIDVNKVKYKSYKNVDHLESERSNLSYSVSTEDKRRMELLERKKEDDERSRRDRQKQYDDRIQNQYQKINQRLIVHK